MQQQDPFGPGGPFGGGEPGPAEMLVGLACYGTLFLISIAVLVLISYLLYRAASALPEPYRQVTPGIAYLVLIIIYLVRMSEYRNAALAGPAAPPMQPPVAP